jgi:death-on-curing protein
MVEFLSVDEVLEIHERLIEKFGGTHGLRDIGLLDSAIFRPRSGYYNDLVTMAAALFESLLINHPFVDGNKRAAFFACDVFLRLNGWKIEVKADQASKFIETSLESGSFDLARLVAWIEEHLKEIP